MQVMSAVRYLTVFIAGAGALLAWTASTEYVDMVSLDTTTISASADAVTPPTVVPQIEGMKPLDFEVVGQWATHSIEIDRSTISSTVDASGDTLVGAMFRVTFKNPVPSEDGKAIFSFIDGVVAPCGYDGVLIVSSRGYTLEGAQVSESFAPTQFADNKRPSAPPTEMYAQLCKGVKSVPKKPAQEDRNRPGNSYTSFVY